MTRTDDLVEFVRESNAIEGIIRDPGVAEMDAYKTFLALDRIEASDVKAFVWTVAKASIRDRPGMNVRVGSHHPPPGGPAIRLGLQNVCWHANEGHSPWQTHVEYERLHPFMDGNGRSGRALWLWMMRRQGHGIAPLGFLQTFYYQTLRANQP